ncbi:MAG TPA: ABC transporter permease [Longimicrobiaceae bacterium]|nr:ABC transporter permease [Longimicrobiaceae bacterium]
MRELWIVLGREFTERVRSRSFLLSTILTPVFLLLIAFGPQLLEHAHNGELSLAIIDATGSGLGEATAARLQAAGGDTHFTVATVPARASVRDSVGALVTAGGLDGYLYLPSNLLSGASAELRTHDSPPSGVERQITAALSSSVQAERLRAVGLAPQQLASLLQPVGLDAARLTSGGQAEHSEAAMVFGLVVTFFLYFLLLLYGTQVMHSVQEEKTNRISEVLVSSIRAPQLMLGKVLGVGGAALLQVAIWVAVGAAILAYPGGPGRGSATLAAVRPFVHAAGAGMLIAILLYMLLGFFIYASLFAAVGAAAASTEDAQRFTFPVMMPLILPIVLAGEIVTAPNDALAVTLSWIPFTSPLVMPMRLGAGAATDAEVAGTFAALLVAVLVIAWIAGKIYRVGILSTGKRASLGDIARWVRSA